MRSTLNIALAALLLAVLLFSSCSPLRCPKCDSDNLREMKADEGTPSHTKTRLECLECGNITYQP